MKDMYYNKIEELDGIKNVLSEASKAINDPYRTINDSPISDVLSGAIGAGLGGGIGFAALYYGGTVGLSAAGITSGLAAAGGLVGGGMVAGMAVLAAPAVILGGAGIYLAKQSKMKKLKQEKERLYNEAIRKHEAIIRKLTQEADASKERADYLQGLNILLQKIIKELKHDLNAA